MCHLLNRFSSISLAQRLTYEKLQTVNSFLETGLNIKVRLQ